MVELRLADTLRFGTDEKATDYVLEAPLNNYSNIPRESNARPQHSSSTNSTNSSTVVGKKQSTRKSREGMLSQRSNSLNHYREKNSIDNTQQDFTLPVVGNKIMPKRYSDRWSRTSQPSNQRMCRLMNTSSLPQVKQRSSMSDDNRDTDSNTPRTKTRHSLAALKTTGSPQESMDKNSDRVNNVAGNQLLQRVVRLQAEVQRKDAEIAHLRRQAGVGVPSLIMKSDCDTNRSPYTFSDMLDKAQLDNEQLKMLLDNSAKKEDPAKGLAIHDFVQIIDNTFFAVCCRELDVINQRVSNASVRDYGDVFTEIAKALQEPFSFRLMEINTRCGAIFEHLSISSADREQLYLQFDHFLKEKIYPISKAFDSILPVLKDAAIMARESVRACSVFSQWSREFGNQLQVQPNWDLMSYKVDDLQTRFKECSMPKHWLPPSLTPLLRIIIYEYKIRFEEYNRKETVLTERITMIKSKLIQLKCRLSSEDQLLIDKIIGYDEQNDEDNLVRENQRLRNVIYQLENQIRLSKNSAKLTNGDLVNRKGYINEDTIRMYPSHSSIQRDFVGSIENHRSLSNDTSELSHNQSQETALPSADRDDNAFRNSSKKAKETTFIEIQQHAPNSPSSSHQDNDELSQCSTHTTVEDSELTLSEVDSCDNQKSLANDADRIEDRITTTPTAGDVALNEINQLYEELREQREQMERSHMHAQSKTEIETVIEPNNKDAGATPHVRTPRYVDNNDLEVDMSLTPLEDAADATQNITITYKNEELAAFNEPNDDRHSANFEHQEEYRKRPSSNENGINEIQDEKDANEGLKIKIEENETVQHDPNGQIANESKGTAHSDNANIDNHEIYKYIASETYETESTGRPSTKASTEISQIETPEFKTEAVSEAIWVNLDSSFDDNSTVINTMRGNVDETLNNKNYAEPHIPRDNTIIDKSAVFSENITNNDSSSDEIKNEKDSIMRVDTTNDIIDDNKRITNKMDSISEHMHLDTLSNSVDMSDKSASDEHQHKEISLNLIGSGNELDSNQQGEQSILSVRSDDSLPFRYERIIQDDNISRRESDTLSLLKHDLASNAINNALHNITTVEDCDHGMENVENNRKNDYNNKEHEEDNMGKDYKETKIFITSNSNSHVDDAYSDEERHKGNCNDVVDNNYDINDNENKFNHESHEEVMIKEDKNPEEKIESTKIQQNEPTKTEANIKSIHQRKSIEFWELASALAQILKVDLPTTDRANTSPPSTSSENRADTRHMRPKSWPAITSTTVHRVMPPPSAKELEARQQATETILRKLQVLLAELASNQQTE